MYGKHQASAPGEPPASDTGHLVTNSGIERVQTGLYKVWFGAEYAEALEFGTPTIAERPFLRPAVAFFESYFYSMVRRIIGG